MAQKIIRFFTTMPGALLPLIGGLLVLAWFIAEQRGHQGPSTGPQRELGQVKPVASVPADRAQQEEVVENRSVIPVQPVVERQPQPQRAALGEKEEPLVTPTPVQSAVSFYVSASPAPTPAPVVRKAPPKIWLPRGIFIPCALVNTVDSSHMDTPVVGEVVRDVWQRNNGTSHLIVPAGTLVNCFATAGRVRDRIEVKGTWSLTFPDGLEYELEGVACDREADPETQEYGLEDGSAGLQGNIYYTDRYAELKAFGAAVVTGVLQGFQTVQGTAYSGNNLEHTPQNAMLQGATSVADLLVLKYLNANDGDETWVQVKAGKEFYIYPMTVIRPDKRSVGAKEQRDDDPQAGATPSPSQVNPAALSVNQVIELERKLGVQAQPQQQPSDQREYDQSNARIHY
jgi:Bacterial conjugation TrbI-like protein